MTDEEKALLEVWKVTIDVQKHFNDLSMRVRNIAITVFGALLAAAGYALKDGATVTILDRSFPLTAWILVAALFCWFAFYLMDLHWYHRLLRGAVRHGKSLEKALSHRLPEIGLTHAIDAASPVYGLRASQRLTIFYGLIGSVILAAALAAFHVSNAYYAALSVAVVIGAVAILFSRPKPKAAGLRKDKIESKPPS
jgi:sterol desaturase/sphingolipid hydroxylase (fatty acid hydroxylase superfamily)